MIHLAVPPPLHKYEAAFVGAHKVVEPPGQIKLLQVIVHEGRVDCVTIAVQVLVHPLVPVTVREYVLACVAEMHWVVSPVLHI